jgi:ankyrin repeat protein
VLHISHITPHLRLASGADINIQSDQGTTALHNATVNCHLATVSMLIRKGANVLIKDKSGNDNGPLPDSLLGKSARDVAVERKNPKLIDYFNDEKRETYGTYTTLRCSLYKKRLNP